MSLCPVLAARTVPRAGLSPVPSTGNPLAQHGMEWPRSGSLVPGHWNRLGSSFGVVGTVGRAVPREFLSLAPGGARSSSMPTAMAAAGNNPGIRNPGSSDLPLAREEKRTWRGHSSTPKSMPGFEIAATAQGEPQTIGVAGIGDPPGAGVQPPPCPDPPAQVSLSSPLLSRGCNQAPAPQSLTLV